MIEQLFLDPCPLLLCEAQYDEYSQKVEDRIRELIENEDWTDRKAAYNQRDELDRDLINKLACRDACKQVYKEVTNDSLWA